VKHTYVPTSDEFRRLLLELSAAPCRAEGREILNKAKGWMLTDLEADLLTDTFRELT
jgi:hypothetical protein